MTAPTATLARADRAATTASLAAVAALPATLTPAARTRAVRRIARTHGLVPRLSPSDVAGRIAARLFMIGAHQ